MILEYNIINSFQILNNRPQEVSSINNNQHQASVKIEETVVEDARFPEHGAKEIIIKDKRILLKTFIKTTEKDSRAKLSRMKDSRKS